MFSIVVCPFVEQVYDDIYKEHEEIASVRNELQKEVSDLCNELNTLEIQNKVTIFTHKLFRINCGIYLRCRKKRKILKKTKLNCQNTALKPNLSKKN